MNTFVESRLALSKTGNPLAFYIDYLHEHKHLYGRSDNPLNDYLETLDYLYELENLSELSLMEIQYAIGELGKHALLDNWIKRFVTERSRKIDKTDLNLWLESIFLRSMNDSTISYNLIDLAIECHVAPISGKDLMHAIDLHSHDYDLMSLAIEYVLINHIDLDDEWLLSKYFTHIPDPIKLQIAEYFIGRYDLKYVEKIGLYDNHQHLEEHMNDLTYNGFIQVKALTLLQTMFYGDFDTEGKGNTGGMSVLLKTFGDALAKREEIGTVITLTIINQWTLDKKMIQWLEGNHLLIRVPFYTDGDLQEAFLKRESYFRRLVASMLMKFEIDVDMVHIRYLDNGSLALARYANEAGKQLIFTLTPDPHRLMPDSEDELRAMKPRKLLSNMNRILVGDQLVERADRLVGIGSESLALALKGYFPQLDDVNIDHKLKMVNEAITMYDGQSYRSQPIEQILSFADTSLVLNVGRLNDLKGQLRLLKTFNHTKMWQDYKLLVIGGDQDNPTDAEAQVMEGFKKYLAKYPHLRERFLHIGGIPNEHIRFIEHQVMKHAFDLPHLYVCSSYKEEFGIAILEAMSEGFIAVAPMNGGAKSYIRHSQNGFLIDTKSWRSMAIDLEKFIDRAKRSVVDFMTIKEHGIKTIENNYTTKKVIEEMLSLYLSIERRHVS